MADESRGWEFFTGFLIGGVVGAAVALLLAPQSGEETRSLIRERGLELRTRGIELSEEARIRAEQLASDARQRAEELEKRGRMALDEQRTRLQDAIEEGKEAASRKRDELMSRLESEKAKRTS
ncbi:MAG: YtxH domain-containing protein [Chloroflexi bacterium]|nr:YtxH domain-containing protein [Chloroflexota bacterium]